jgi:hypothetical protein
VAAIGAELSFTGVGVTIALPEAIAVSEAVGALDGDELD